MGLLGGYDSEEEEEDGGDGKAAGSSAPSGSNGPTASRPTKAEEGTSSEEEEDEPEVKRARLTGPNPLGLLAPKFSTTGSKPKAALAAATAFVPSQVRKKGRVVSANTDNISDRSFASSNAPSG
eukprot:symbB.v1.2.023088.t1/scaffold2089.1/size89944/3